MWKEGFFCSMACIAMIGICNAGVSLSDSGMNVSSPKASIKGEVEETLNGAQKAFDEASKVTYQGMIPKTEDIQADAEDCLDEIMNADYSGMFGFDLGLPSIDDLLGAACDEINSSIDDHLDSVSQKYSADFLDGLVSSEMEMELGNSDNSYGTIDYYNEGKRIADDLWEQIEEEETWLQD